MKLSYFKTELLAGYFIASASLTLIWVQSAYLATGVAGALFAYFYIIETSKLREKQRKAKGKGK